MRARGVMIDGFRGIAGVRVGDVDVPEPEDAEVRVRLTAAGVGPWVSATVSLGPIAS